MAPMAAPMQQILRSGRIQTRSRMLRGMPTPGVMMKNKCMAKLDDEIIPYQRQPKTQQIVEMSYYNYHSSVQPNLLKITKYWEDYCEYLLNHGKDEIFLSKYFCYEDNSINNVILLLATLDLPFKVDKSVEYVNESDNNKMIMKSDVIIFKKSYKEVDVKIDERNVSLLSKFYDPKDKMEIINGVSYPKYKRDNNYLNGVEYGYCIYISNYLPINKTYNILISFPEGSIPIGGSLSTYSKIVTIKSFETQKIELGSFYFPNEGKFKLYPCHVSGLNGDLEGWCEIYEFNVTKEKISVDENSWLDVSSNGNNDQIMKYLKNHSLKSVNLSNIYYKLVDKEFYEIMMKFLEDNLYYDDTIYSFSLYHNDKKRICDYLLNSATLTNILLPYSENTLIKVDGYEKMLHYQHTEYNPFINPRIHTLKQIPRITNDEMNKTLNDFYLYVSSKKILNDHDYYIHIYYLLLQDRLKESEEVFDKYLVKERKNGIPIPKNEENRLQFDYLSCYFDCYKLTPECSNEISKKYLDYGIESWRTLFKRINNTVNNNSNDISSYKDRDDRQLHISSITPSLSMKIDTNENVINISSNNVEECQINYYVIDIELLFSDTPFLKKIDSSVYNYIYPNYSVIQKINEEHMKIPILNEMKTKTGIIEIVYNGNHIHELYNYCLFSVMIKENMGILQIIENENHKSLPCAYIKVYSKDNTNKIEFYKDGYSDLSGRFDYASISTDQMDNAVEFGILIMTENHGSYITQAKVPK